MGAALCPGAGSAAGGVPDDGDGGGGGHPKELQHAAEYCGGPRDNDQHSPWLLSASWSHACGSWRVSTSVRRSTPTSREFCYFIQVRQNISTLFYVLYEIIVLIFLYIHFCGNQHEANLARYEF